MWLDVNITFNNNTYNFSEKADNIEIVVKDNFIASDIKKTGINKLSTEFSLNINYSNSKFYGAFYFQTGQVLFLTKLIRIIKMVVKFQMDIKGWKHIITLIFH